MNYDDADDAVAELFESLVSRYQIGLETPMRGNCFISDSIQLYYKCHKVNFIKDGLHIDSPDWMKSKTATINPMNKKDNKCFQYAETVALNHADKKIRKE